MDTRQRIIAAASELIMEHGVDSTPTVLVCKKAGVANGTLFRHFPTKQDLVYAVYSHLVDSVADAVLADYSEESSAKERFFGYWSGVLKYLLWNPREASLLMYLTTTPYIDDSFREGVIERVVLAQKKLLADAVNEGLRQDVGARTIANLMFGALAYSAMDTAKQPSAISEKRINRIIQIFWDGVS